jgi:hypothetical protein
LIYYYETIAVELSESLSDGVSEHRLSEDAGSGLKGFYAKNEPGFRHKTCPKKEALGKYCFLRPVMLD